MRKLLHDVQDDRNVMRREIPGDVDIFLEEAEVEASRGDIAQIAEIAVIDDFLDFPHGGRVKERVAHHDGETLLFA